MCSSRCTPRLIVLSALLILLAACNLTHDNDNSTPVSTSSSTATSTSMIVSGPLVYYYFAAIASGTFPAGSVVIVPGELILSPTISDIPRGDDVAANIQSALQALINDPRNGWTSSNLTLTSVTFNAGQATVVLNGEIVGAGDVVLIAARMQILMTVFADSSVQAANVTLNQENIANLGISHSSEAKPVDYLYTRQVIETFMAENAYNGGS